MAYLPQVDALCWFEPADVEGRTALTIRLAAPRNGQRAGIRSYEDYRW